MRRHLWKSTLVGEETPAAGINASSSGKCQQIDFSGIAARTPRSSCRCSCRVTLNRLMVLHKNLTHLLPHGPSHVDSILHLLPWNTSCCCKGNPQCSSNKYCLIHRHKLWGLHPKEVIIIGTLLLKISETKALRIHTRQVSRCGRKDSTLQTQSRSRGLHNAPLCLLNWIWSGRYRGLCSISLLCCHGRLVYCNMDATIAQESPVCPQLMVSAFTSEAGVVAVSGLCVLAVQTLSHTCWSPE